MRARSVAAVFALVVLTLLLGRPSQGVAAEGPSTIFIASVASDGTQANRTSDWPSVSASGQFVAFRTSASNLVPGDTNGTYDIFVHDSVAQATTRVSVASDGTEANGRSYFPVISATGRFVAFLSYAGNLVFVSISDEGRYVAFQSHATNSAVDELKKVANPTVVSAVDRLTAADSTLAHIALASAEALGGDADAIAAGREALVRASGQITKGKPSQADRSFLTAWELGQLAVGVVPAGSE